LRPTFPDGEQFGYSSLSYLRSFPFDKIKIDRSFVSDLQLGAPSSAIIRAITTLANALGMETLAEGVELQEQADLLKSEGCQQVQGYLFHQPLSATAVSELIRNGNPKCLPNEAWEKIAA
jgi:EAL domain-containing protein (putative c-di-GMP-specific phosphodiesterase class I)